MVVKCDRKPVFGTLKPFAFVFVAFFMASPTWADINIVQNPGFETGSFADWTVNTSAGDAWQIDTAGEHGNSPFAGAYFVSTGCVGAPCISGTASQQSSLSQTLPTTAGQTYDLTFEFMTGGNSTPNELKVLWGGSTALDLGPAGTLGPVSTYTLYSVDVTATSSSTTLTFLGRQDPGWDALDNVSVVSTGTVTPEPGSYAVLMLVLGSLILVARSRRAKQR